MFAVPLLNPKLANGLTAKRMRAPVPGSGAGHAASHTAVASMEL